MCELLHIIKALSPYRSRLRECKIREDWLIAIQPSYKY